jgi:hypothetical protein
MSQKDTYLEELIALYTEDRNELISTRRENLVALQQFNTIYQDMVDMVNQQKNQPFWTKHRKIQIGLYGLITVLFLITIIIAIRFEVSIIVNLTEWSFAITPTN